MPYRRRRRTYRKSYRAKQWRHFYGSWVHDVSFASGSLPIHVNLARFEGANNRVQKVREIDLHITCKPTSGATTPPDVAIAGHIVWAYGKNVSGNENFQDIADPENPERTWRPQPFHFTYRPNTMVTGTVHRMRWPSITLNEDDVFMAGLRVNQVQNFNAEAKIQLVTTAHALVSGRYLEDVNFDGAA